MLQAQSDLNIHLHSGMCDASAAVALDSNHFAVGNDEDNFIRVYKADADGGPVAVTDLSRFLKVDEKWPETDLEGAAWLGGEIFWITSHGRNKEGKFRESRHRLFSTRVISAESSLRLEPVGKPYRHLLRDLVRNRKLASFHLLEASQRAPKEADALNIEGLAATPRGHLLIGFRNPIPEGQALIVPLLNPHGIFEGQSALFGDPILLDLGGLGVRDIKWDKTRYIIIGGEAGTGGGAKVFLWNGGDDMPKPIASDRLAEFNPEALVVYPEHPGRMQLFSDDGRREVDGVDCKTLADSNRKRFRSFWLRLP